jgi:hypothetical protein
MVVCATLWAHWMQPPLSFQEGRGWDGKEYTDMAERLARFGWPVSGPEPAAHRVGVPLLVATLMRLTGAQVVETFRAVNTFFAAGAALLLWMWLRRILERPSVVFTCLGLFLVQWCGPVRHTAWYPTLVDPAFFFSLCLALLSLDMVWQKPSVRGAVLLNAALALAILARETGATLFAGMIVLLRNRAGWAIVIGAVVTTALTVVCIAHLMADPEVVWTRSVELAGARRGLIHPKLWGIAWAIAFGPVLVCALVCPLAVLRQWQRAPYVPLLILSLVPAWVGPTEVRCVYWAAPMVLAAIGAGLEGLALLRGRAFEVIATLVVSQSIAARVFWPIPDSPQGMFVGPLPTRILLTPWDANLKTWEHIGVWWANRSVLAIEERQYVILFGVLAFLFLCHLLRRRMHGDSRPAI